MVRLKRPGPYVPKEEGEGAKRKPTQTKTPLKRIHFQVKSNVRDFLKKGIGKFPDRGKVESKAKGGNTTTNISETKQKRVGSPK